MTYKYTLGDSCEYGLYALYRDGIKTQARMRSLDLIKEDSVFISGGDFYGGDFYSGYFHGGDFRGGSFYSGYFRGGSFYSGYFHGGDFYGGDFHGGDFRGGSFYSGVFRGGVFRGGGFHGGVFHGGDFHGGVFRGGDFYDGVFHGGEFTKSPLQIKGTRHFINYTMRNGIPSIAIGCVCHSIEDWQLKVEEIGEQNGYNHSQISEYRIYIELFAKIYQ